MIGDGCEDTLTIGLLDLYGNDFFVLSGCIALLSIFLFIIFFYIEDYIRFRCGGKAKWKLFWGKLNLKILGWIWFWD